MSWATSAEDFIGTWKLVDGSPPTDFTIGGSPLQYTDSQTQGGALVSFDSVSDQLDIEGRSFALKAAGYTPGGAKQVEVVSAKPPMGLELPTEGERYEHEES